MECRISDKPMVLLRIQAILLKLNILLLVIPIRQIPVHLMYVVLMQACRRILMLFMIYKESLCIKAMNYIQMGFIVMRFNNQQRANMFW